jgi:osmoprotectant transport system substrate-binding protein
MHSTRLLLAIALLGGVLLSACGSGGDSSSGTASPTSTQPADMIDRDAANGDVSLTIGSKDFTEQRVLAEIYAQGLRAAGFDAHTKLDVGDEQQALSAVRAGMIDAYPEYTGTALLSFFGKRPDELPRDPEDAYAEAKKGFAADGLVEFPPTPFTSSNEVAVTKETADKLGLKTISDLSGKSQNLTLYGSPECRQRLDCLLGLQQVYGLKFKKFVPVDIARRHDVLSSGRADVSIVFTTDPQIQREKEVLLEDDKGMFPPYNSTLVMKQATADKAGPNLPRTLELIQQQLTDENMQELNARVDLDRKTPAVVAKEYLTETGLIGSG